MTIAGRPSSNDNTTGKSSKLIPKALRLSLLSHVPNKKKAKYKPPPLTKDNLEVHKKLLPSSSETKFDRITRYVNHQASVQEEFVNSSNYLLFPHIEGIEETGMGDQNHLQSAPVSRTQSKSKIRHLFTKFFIEVKSILFKPESISFHAHPGPAL